MKSVRHGAKKARANERRPTDRGAEDDDRGVEKARGASTPRSLMALFAMPVAR